MKCPSCRLGEVDYEAGRDTCRICSYRLPRQPMGADPRVPWWASGRFWRKAGPVVFFVFVIAGTARLWGPLVF